VIAAHYYVLADWLITNPQLFDNKALATKVFQVIGEGKHAAVSIQRALSQEIPKKPAKTKGTVDFEKLDQKSDESLRSVIQVSHTLSRSFLRNFV
jgi:hypothetical protein